MPHVLLALPDVYESVTRRVAVDAAAQLARTMQLPEETQVYLPGNTDTVPMNGGTFGDCCSKTVKYPADTRLVVRYSEEAEEDWTLTTAVNNTENLPIFLDETRGIVIRPVYRFVTVTLSLEYTAPSIVIAQRWLDEMRAKISMGRAELYQELHYHFGMPPASMLLLKTLYETMESSPFPTGKTLEQWIAENFQRPTTTTATLIDTDKTLTIQEQQLEVLGWFDFTTTPPTPEKDGEGNGTYTSSFNYQFSYNRPTQLYMKYPMLVHNKAIPKQFRPQKPYESFWQHDRKVSVTKGSLQMAMRLLQANRIDYIHHPDTDDWTTLKRLPERLTFFTGLIVLQKDDKRTLLDLANLGKLTFTPPFLEFFYQEAKWLFSPYESIFEFRLYENDEWLKDISMEMIPGTVTFRTLRDLNPQKFYHVQISLKRNWYLLNPDMLTRLRRYPSVVYWSLKALGVTLGGYDLDKLPLLGLGGDRTATHPGEGSLLGKGPLPGLDWSNLTDDEKAKLIKRGVVNRNHLDKAIRDLDDILRKPVDWNRIGPTTVMFFELLTEKLGR